MMFRNVSAALLLLAIGALQAAADQTPSASKHPTPPPPISKETRMDLIRAFESELVFIRSPFPMGRKGLTLKNGVISPGGEELQHMIALWGPAVKPGDEARITAIVVKSNLIHFEINGGPIKKQKWYQHIQVGAGNASSSVTPGEATANPRGSYVDLAFDHYVPDLNPRQLKDLLRPVFDFDSKSAREAYLDTVPPKVKQAIENHQVLVGMNREMVIYAKGRAPKKIREKDGETEYEDWIYGEPPQDVDFVRLVGDEVVRIETMKVSGEKIVRTAKEVDLEPQPSVAKSTPAARPPNAPTLRRPGEEAPSPDPNDAAKAQQPPTRGDPNPPPPPTGPHLIADVF